MILLDNVILAALILTNNEIITFGTKFHLTLKPQSQN